MGILDWLFGSKPPASRRRPAWERSENGNPTMVGDGLRITVFPYYRDWKYLIAPEDGSIEPFYSDRFRTEADAKAAAVRHAADL